MNTQTPVILAGFGHAVSKTGLTCAVQGSLINQLALDFVKWEAAWNRTLATRASNDFSQTLQLLNKIRNGVRVENLND